MIDTLKGWNSNHEKLNAEYDKRVTVALLLICVTPDEISTFSVSADVKDLIEGTCIHSS